MHFVDCTMGDHVYKKCRMMASGHWRAKATSTGDFCFPSNTCEPRRRSCSARSRACWQWTTSRSKFRRTLRCRSGTLISSPGMTSSVSLARYFLSDLVCWHSRWSCVSFFIWFTVVIVIFTCFIFFCVRLCCLYVEIKFILCVYITMGARRRTHRTHVRPLNLSRFAFIVKRH